MPLITALPDNTNPAWEDLIVCVHDPLGTPQAMSIKAETLYGFIRNRLRQTGRVTADRTSNSTSLVGIPDLNAFTLAANKVYRFSATMFFVTSATTVGMHFGVNFTGDVTYLRAGHINPVTAPTAAGSAIAHGAVTAVNTKILATTAGPGATPTMAIIEGLIEVGANGGTFSIMACSETATNGTVQRGSHAVVELVD